MKKMSKGMLMTALICGAVYLGGSPVYANELQEFALDEYVVTAARTETKLVDTPANISVVDAQTIEERHYQDVSEVLKDVPGANVLDDGLGASEKKIMLNGDERVLILVDGRRMNFDMGTMSRSGFDMNQLPDVSLIERIEVLKGAGGALYGSDAVGGVVNIITKKADRDFGKVSVGYGSMGTKDYNAMYSIKEGKTGVSIAASKYEQDYYKYRDAKTDTTKRWPGDTDFKNEKVSLKVDQELTNDTSIAIGYDYSKFEGHSTGSVTSPWQAVLDKKTQNVYVKYDWMLNEKDNGYFQYYHNELEYNNDGAIEEKTNGIDAQQTITVSDNNKMVVGMSWRKSDVDSSYNDFTTGLLTKNYKDSIENLAFFLNDTWEFAPSWTLNAGVRYDDHSNAGDDTTLSVGLNKKINDESHAYINWGQVFRAPTTDDLYYFNPGYNYYGNPNLSPETGETWTIGYNTKFNNKTNFGISYFESDLDDAIDWAYDDKQGKLFASNVDKQKKQGLELTLNHELNDNVNLIASYTYTKVENNDNNTGYLRDAHYNPNTYRLGINYQEGKWDANAWVRYGSGCDTSTIIKTDWMGNEQIVGDYADSNYLTVDVSVTYKATKYLSIYAKGYNLFNEAYAEQAGTTNGSYDYPAQSRRFIVGAEYKF